MIISLNICLPTDFLFGKKPGHISKLKKYQRAARYRLEVLKFRQARRPEATRTRWSKPPLSFETITYAMLIDTRKCDAILPMREPYMQQIVTVEKTYEFRKYCLQQSVKRIWFYSTAPQSSIEYICEILPAETRNSGDLALEEDGLGNKEFNTRHKDWEGYNFAYKILSVYRIESPITLQDLKNDHGMKSPPRGLVYTPPSLLELVEWQKQTKLR